MTIFRNLLRALAAWDGAADCIEHQDPPQRKLTHVYAVRQHAADFFHGLESGVVIHACKSLARVEGFTMPIEVSVIIGSESGVPVELTGEQSARERHARQDPHLLLLGLRKKQFCRTHAKTVEYDLNRLHVGKFDGLQRFFHSLNAHSVIADFSGGYEVIQN